jgi:hypothetical protein
MTPRYEQPIRGTMTDIVDQLIDLHKQATHDHSHFYTGRIINEALAEITRLRRTVTELMLRDTPIRSENYKKAIASHRERILQLEAQLAAYEERPLHCPRCNNDYL